MTNRQLKLMVDQTWGDLLGQCGFVLSADLQIGEVQHLIYVGEHFKLRFSLGIVDREIAPSFSVGKLSASDDDKNWHPLLHSITPKDDWVHLADLKPEMTVEEIREYVRNLGADNIKYVSPEDWFLTQKKQFLASESKLEMYFLEQKKGPHNPGRPNNC